MFEFPLILTWPEKRLPGKTNKRLPEVAGLRVLVAEDNPVNQKLVSRILEKSGMLPKSVDDGEKAVREALAAVQAGDPFDVVLMDMQMPVLDGYEATAKLRQAGYELPIIALTAHAMASDREKCLLAGCTDYATKPFEARKLVEQIGRLAEGSRTRSGPA
jgi:CheY-like chemotaxis protein